MTDRAALVERVTAEIRKYDLTSDEIAAFAISLIRAEVLEEAAGVADVYGPLSAAAIRALKGTT
jgi:hypothetical protein